MTSQCYTLLDSPELAYPPNTEFTVSHHRASLSTQLGVTPERVTVYGLTPLTDNQILSAGALTAVHVSNTPFTLSALRLTARRNEELSAHLRDCREIILRLTEQLSSQQREVDQAAQNQVLSDPSLAKARSHGGMDVQGGSASVHPAYEQTIHTLQNEAKILQTQLEASERSRMSSQQAVIDLKAEFDTLLQEMQTGQAHNPGASRALTSAESYKMIAALDQDNGGQRLDNQLAHVLDRMLSVSSLDRLSTMVDALEGTVPRDPS